MPNDKVQWMFNSSSQNTYTPHYVKSPYNKCSEGKIAALYEEATAHGDHCSANSVTGSFCPPLGQERIHQPQSLLSSEVGTLCGTSDQRDGILDKPEDTVTFTTEKFYNSKCLRSYDRFQLRGQQSYASSHWPSQLQRKTYLIFLRQ